MHKAQLPALFGVPEQSYHVNGRLYVADTTTGLISGVTDIDFPTLLSLGCTTSPNLFSTIITSTYALQSSDNGKVLLFTNGSAIALTIPTGLPINFECGIIQRGAGQITFSATAPATFNNRQNFTKSAGQYAFLSLIAIARDTFVLAGDGA